MVRLKKKKERKRKEIQFGWWEPPKKLKCSMNHIFLLVFSLQRNDSSRMFEAEWKEMMERVLIIKAGDKNSGIGECPLCQEEVRLIYLFLTDTSGCTNYRLLPGEFWSKRKVLIWIPSGDNYQFEETVLYLCGKRTPISGHWTLSLLVVLEPSCVAKCTPDWSGYSGGRYF